MDTIENGNPSLPRRLLAWTLAFALPACLAACAGRAPRDARPAMLLDLDSLNRVVEHNDSVEANHFFYEDAFAAYKAEFPGMDKPTYMSVARGKDRSFCLFQPGPGPLCAEIGDKFRALALEEPARDAYEAGLLSEGVNGDSLNIRLWSGMAQVHLGWGERERAVPYLVKVLEVDAGNRWAKRIMAPSAPGGGEEADSAKKASAGPTARSGAAKRTDKRRVRSREQAGRAKEREASRGRRIGGLERGSGLARLPIGAEGGKQGRDAVLD